MHHRSSPRSQCPLHGGVCDFSGTFPSEDVALEDSVKPTLVSQLGVCLVFKEPDWIKLCQLAALDWKQVERAGGEHTDCRDCCDCWCRL